MYYGDIATLPQAQLPNATLGSSLLPLEILAHVDGWHPPSVKGPPARFSKIAGSASLIVYLIVDRQSHPRILSSLMICGCGEERAAR